MTTLIKTCKIAPLPDTGGHRSLPLTFSDMYFLDFHIMNYLMFYDFPCSKLWYLEKFIPKLEHSLSLALQHYFPLAGYLVYPLDTDKKKPTIRYMPGDSVPLAIFESTNGFDLLVGNQPRDADLFYDYIPRMPPIVTKEPKYKLIQVLALQATHFPGRGICIGIAHHHVIGDASSILGFIRAWASICKLGEGEEYPEYSLPVFDRSLIMDPHGLQSVFWNRKKQTPFNLPPLPLPTNRVRATFILNPAQIKKHKDLVVAKFPVFAHLSSFVVTSAYVWTCMAKSIGAGEEEGERRVDDDDEQLFLFAADIRARIDPPVPINYFGNCLSGGFAKVRQGELVGPDGLFVAAQAIAEDMKNRVNDKDKVMEALDVIMMELESRVSKCMLSVSGSARFDLYGADFGLGRARKVEALSIDGEKYSMSLCTPRDCEGGLEIGLSLPRVVMDVFAGLFNDGLN